MAEPLWKDAQGRIRGIVAENSVSVGFSEARKTVGFQAYLLTQDFEATNAAILLDMLPEEAWQLAHAILGVAAEQKWEFAKPIPLKGPSDPREMN